MAGKNTSHENLKLILEHYLNYLKDPTILQILLNKYTNLFAITYNKSAEKFHVDGYCGNFILPYAEFEKLWTDLGFDDKTLSELGRILFGVTNDSLDVSNTMYGDPYYVFNALVILAAAGLVRRKDIPNNIKANLIKLIKLALFFIQAKLWNGRLKKYIKFCNKKIMDCVIERRRGSSLVKKYPSPLELITDYFVNTILNKYIVEYIKTGDIKYIEKAFKQSWNRIDQLFSSSPRPGGADGEEKRMGLANEYYYVYKTGECMSSTKAKDLDTGLSLVKSEHEIIYELAEKIKDYILYNSNDVLPKKIEMIIKRSTYIASNIISTIPKVLKSPDLDELLTDVISFIIRRFDIHNDRSEVCSDAFLIMVSKLVSSKNSAEIMNFKEALEEIARKVYLKYDKLTRPTQLNLLKAILIILAYYISEYICYHYTPGTD